MDEEPLLYQLREANRTLHIIAALLAAMLIPILLAGRGAVLVHGFLALLGF